MNHLYALAVVASLTIGSVQAQKDSVTIIEDFKTMENPWFEDTEDFKSFKINPEKGEYYLECKSGFSMDFYKNKAAGPRVVYLFSGIPVDVTLMDNFEVNARLKLKKTEQVETGGFYGLGLWSVSDTLLGTVEADNSILFLLNDHSKFQFFHSSNGRLTSQDRWYEQSQIKKIGEYNHLKIRYSKKDGYQLFINGNLISGTENISSEMMLDKVGFVISEGVEVVVDTFAFKGLY